MAQSAPNERAARKYLEAGWPPLPLPADQKGPPPEGLTGYDGVDLCPEDLSALPWHNVGVRMPCDVIGIDVDAYRGGKGTLDELVALLGPLPLTVISHNHRDKQSGIRMFRVPENMPWVATLAGIDIIQRNHRYAVVAPSTHPEGRKYEWFDQRHSSPSETVPLVDELPDLPWTWIGHLSRPDDAPEQTHSHAVDGPTMRAFLAEATQADAPRYIEAIAESYRDRVEDGFSRHDRMQHALTWAMEHARADVLAAQDGVDVLAECWKVSILPDVAADVRGAQRRYECWSDTRVTEFEAMLRHAVGKALAKTDDELHALHDRIAGIPIVTSEKIVAYHNLPDEFWQRPLLAAIRVWAHSRHRSADAVYACVRSRFAVMIPPTLRVDTGIATPVSLNVLTAVVGNSGVGKSSAMAMAEELVTITNPDIFVGPLGTGEGASEAYYDEVIVPNPQTGKNEKVRKRVRDAALLDLDEGEALMQMGTRSNAILLPELRKAFSGRSLGQSNASSTSRRNVAANTYRLVLLIGLQPEAALRLLGDAGTGTPQRFVLFNGGDPTIPEDATLTALPVMPPAPAAITGKPHLMTVEAGVLAEIRERDLAVQRGELRVAPLDSHRPANRIKEAAILACLDGRSKQINAEDWRLAGMVLDNSDALRAAVLATKAAADQLAAEAKGSRDAVVEGAKERKLVAQLAEGLIARVKAAGPEGISRSKLRKSVSSSSRHRFAAALAAAVADGKIVLDGDVCKPGK